MAPHFASELWSLFIRVPNRINEFSKDINWEQDVLEQSWPKIDSDYALELTFKVRLVKFFYFKNNVSRLFVVKVNGYPKGVKTFTAEELKKIDLKLALQYALENPEVKEYVADYKIERSNYVYYSDCHGILDVFLEPRQKVKDVVKQ